MYRALDEPALRFRSIGRQRLKNIPEEIEVYEFSSLPGDGSATPVRRTLSLEALIVAVLPIHAEMEDASVRATADVLRVDLIHRLAKIPHLKVIDAAGRHGAHTQAGLIRRTGAVGPAAVGIVTSLIAHAGAVGRSTRRRAAGAASGRGRCPGQREVRADELDPAHRAPSLRLKAILEAQPARGA